MLTTKYLDISWTGEWSIRNGSRPPFLPIAILISFEKYIGPTIITSTESIKVVPIKPVQRAGKVKLEGCARVCKSQYA